MKTTVLPNTAEMQKAKPFSGFKGKLGKNNLFVYALQLVLLYILVFAALSTFAQSPAKVSSAPGTLEFAKQTIAFNSGKVYLNWVSKANSTDCVYVIERSVDGIEYEPVGLKEGIGSPVELLYSWVDTKPVAGTAHYRIKQINDQGTMVSQAEPKSVTAPGADPLFMNKEDRMVQAK